MRTYSIDYTEVYSKNYEVKANTFEEAKEKLREDIFIGDTDAPECCINSYFEDVTEYEKKSIQLTKDELELLADCVLIALSQYNKTIEILGNDKAAVASLKESRNKYNMLLHILTEV